MKRPVELLMFDLDGTLADTGADLADAVNFTRARFDLPPLPDRQIYVHVGRGVEHLLRNALPEGSADYFREVMRLFLTRYEAHLLDRTVLYPGAVWVLNHFHGKRRAVVSNKIERLTRAVVRGLGVEKHFDAILGGDSAAEKKPHPALLHSILRRFDIAPSRAVMIGDGDTDIEAGKRAGVMTCGVSFGLGSYDDLLAAGPDFVIDDLSALAELFC